MKKFLKKKKNLLIILLGLLCLIKLRQENLRFLFWVLGGVSITGFLDFFINKFFYKRKISPKSAIISGFIVAGILDYHQSFWVLVVFSALAIISKHVIKFKKKHVFNPANLALFIATLLKIPLTWTIESNIYLIIALGLYFIYNLGKIPHVVGFLVFFSGLLATQGINPLMLVGWFFMFIMLIEPKTSGFGLWKGFIFGSIAGAGSFIVLKFLPGYDFFVSSLFLANLARLLLEKLKPIAKI